jgi:hypothetical protein
MAIDVVNPQAIRVGRAFDLLSQTRVVVGLL